jgi:hypothetical protein
MKLDSRLDDPLTRPGNGVGSRGHIVTAW